MPPAVFVAAAAGTYDPFSEDCSFALPSATKPGDTLIFVIASPSGDTLNGDATLASNDFLEFVDAPFPPSGDPSRIMVCRKIFEASDGPSITIDLNDPGNPILCAVLVYRDLANVASLGASGTETAGVPTTNFVCPSRTLTRYSDLYLGIVTIATAAVAVTPPAGTTERFEQQISGCTLEVFEFLKESAGATGTKTATTVANQQGGAISIALSTNGPRGFGKAIKISPAGCIGLPTEGV